jgi:hypothetical protein
MTASPDNKPDKKEETEPEEPLSEGSPPENVFSIPSWLRHAIAFFLTLGLTGSIVLFVAYFTDEKPSWEPSKIGLIDFIIFCTIGLALCALPWERYQFRIRRIGPLEIEQIVSAQARERDEGLHELRQRVEAVEVAGRPRSDNKSKLAAREEELAGLIKSFLSVHKAPFSPTRLAVWGVQQPGFQDLGKYGRDEIRRVLRGMVAKKELETVVGKRGSTLYRVHKATE